MAAKALILLNGAVNTLAGIEVVVAFAAKLGQRRLRSVQSFLTLVVATAVGMARSALVIGQGRMQILAGNFALMTVNTGFAACLVNRPHTGNNVARTSHQQRQYPNHPCNASQAPINSHFSLHLLNGSNYTTTGPSGNNRSFYCYSDCRMIAPPAAFCYGTPMLKFAVSDEKNRWLVARMAELGVDEQELEETFVRSSGAGGQHVNKTATCVHLRHRSSGIEIKCMQDRSQSVNRFLARRELLEKLAADRGLVTPKTSAADKIRRQKAANPPENTL
jgi:peptide chain release factor